MFAKGKISKTPMREINAPLSIEGLDHILIHRELLTGLLNKGKDFLHIYF